MGVLLPPRDPIVEQGFEGSACPKSGQHGSEKIFIAHIGGVETMQEHEKKLIPIGQDSDSIVPIGASAPQLVNTRQKAIQDAYRSLLESFVSKGTSSDKERKIAWEAFKLWCKDYSSPNLVSYHKYLLDSTDVYYLPNSDKPQKYKNIPAFAYRRTMLIGSIYADMVESLEYVDLLEQLAMSMAQDAAGVNLIINSLKSRMTVSLSLHRVTSSKYSTEGTRLPKSALSSAIETCLASGSKMDKRDALALFLLGFLGIRSAELLDLQLADVLYIENGVRCVNIRHGKGNKQRYIAYGTLLPLFEQLLKVWQHVYPLEDSTHLFPSFHKGGKLRSKQMTYRALNKMVKARLGIAPHDLRRTSAALSYEAGMRLGDIADNMGHSDTKVTKGYLGEINLSQRQMQISINIDVPVEE